MRGKTVLIFNRILKKDAKMVTVEQGDRKQERSCNVWGKRVPGRINHKYKILESRHA